MAIVILWVLSPKYSGLIAQFTYMKCASAQFQNRSAIELVSQIYCIYHFPMFPFRVRMWRERGSERTDRECPGGGDAYSPTARQRTLA